MILKKVISSGKYQNFREDVKSFINRIKADRVKRTLERLERSIKGYVTPFYALESLGFRFFNVSEGNNIEKLLPILKKVKDLKGPVILLVKTEKGKGYCFAEENKEKFHGIAPFNIETGEAEFVKIKDAYKQMETLRATSALPFISEIIEVGDKKYLDGGISNSIPIDFFEKQDFDKVIVILTRPITYRKEKTTGIQYKLFYKKYPKLVEKLENRYKEYNDTVDKIVELEKEGKLFVIRPSENITIKRLEKDVEKLQKVYDLGLKDGNNIIEDLKIQLGSASVEKSSAYGSMQVRGRDMVSGLPRIIEVEAVEIAEAMSEIITQIIDAVRDVLEQTPPEIASDVIDHGIVLTGGGALLRNLAEVISDYTQVPAFVANDPLDCVALGTGKILANPLLMKK